MTTLKNVAYAILFLFILDAMIVFMSLVQIGIEGNTGYWAPFWQTQAKFVIGLLQ